MKNSQLKANKFIMMLFILYASLSQELKIKNPLSIIEAILISVDSKLVYKLRRIKIKKLKEILQIYINNF